MAYHAHPGSFDPIHDTLAAVADPRDPIQIAEARTTVEAQLASRPTEEVDGEGRLRKDFAFERISGSITDLRVLRRRAVNASALPEFVDLIDRVIAEAMFARDAAPRRSAKATASAERKAATWATAPLPDEGSALPDWLSDI